MKRRRFLRFFAAIGAVAALPVRAATGRRDDAETDPGDGDIDPYFLETGDLAETDQENVEDFVAYQERLVAGDDVAPRGRPQRAPTYGLLRGEFGRVGGFAGPLSVRPVLAPARAYEVNAQILGFHASSADWRAGKARGSLTIELRARLAGERMTWLYGQQFDVYQGGAATLGQEFIAQRQGQHDPVVTDEPKIEIRIQLMHHRQRARILGTILRIFSYVSALAFPTPTPRPFSVAEAVPAVRIPRMLQEGTIFAQAFFGNFAQGQPLWRSGFTSYALAEGGGRLALTPGVWVVIDGERVADLHNVRMIDAGGRVMLARDDEPLDANYLVLDVTMTETTPPGYLYPSERFRDVIPKEIPPETGQ